MSIEKRKEIALVAQPGRRNDLELALGPREQVKIVNPIKAIPEISQQLLEHLPLHLR